MEEEARLAAEEERRRRIEAGEEMPDGGWHITEVVVVAYGDRIACATVFNYPAMYVAVLRLWRDKTSDCLKLRK